MARFKAKTTFLVGILAATFCWGQISPVIYPVNSHVTLYFPHLADGGPRLGQQWQTSLEFVNPGTLAAHVEIRLYDELGFPLSLNFGAGSLTVHNFTVPPAGRVTLRSTIAADHLIEGQAIATSDIPIQGTVLFRNIVNGAAVIEVSAPPTLPTSRYTSLATRDLGVALANVSTVSKTFQVTALDSSGTALGSALIGVPGLGHIAFNLVDKISTLPLDFSGSIVITPQVAGDQVLAWTLNVERGLISTLPSGPAEWPISHSDRIMLVYKRLLAAAPTLLAGVGNNLSLQNPPTLVISADPAVNAFANATQTVQINLALSELVSDSSSELAFLVAHELAHSAQYRSGSNTVLLANNPTNREPDADLIAMILVLSAGFDPYGAAGAIAKLSVANGSSGLVSPTFDGLTDPTSAFNQARINSMPGLLTSACSYPTMAGFCTPYKAIIHPHFPGSAPL